MQDTTETEYLFKVLIVGDIGTGKTSILKQSVHGVFSEKYSATIGVDFALKTKKHGDDTFRLQMWDIAGQERFGNMTRVYYRESAGAFVVVDATRPSTFEGAKKWKCDLLAKNSWDESYPQEIVPIILLVNKIDLIRSCDEPHINYDDFCKENGFNCWFSTSALQNHNLEEAYVAMINILKNMKRQPDEDSDCDNDSANITIVNDPQQQNQPMPFCDFLKDIAEMLAADRINDTQKIKSLRGMLNSICFDPTLDQIRKQMRSDKRSYEIIKGIRDILVDGSMDDPHKVTNVSDFILNYGVDNLGLN